MSKFRDHLWLWGQDVMSHQMASWPNSQRGIYRNSWCIPDGNRMDPAAGARELNIPNVFRVVMSGKPVPPFDEETRKLADMSQVVWSAVGDEGSIRNNEQTDLPEVLRQAKLFSNVTGAVLDDFFRKPESGDQWARWDIGTIRRMKEELHNASPNPLQFYVVWYKQALQWPVAEYLKEFDVITYWNLRSVIEQAELKDDLRTMLEKTPGMRRMTGCYLWNYGGGKPLSVKELQYECEIFYDMLMQGQTEGIIFCANCVIDVGGPAIEWVKNWIAEHADDPVED